MAASLAALHWSEDDLDPDYPALLANAGAEHLILVTRTHDRLAELDYDFDGLAAIMQEHDLITLQLIWPKSKRKYFSRNPFAGSGVVEDPATGAAAAAFGGYLRELGKIGHERRVHHPPGRRDGSAESDRGQRDRGRAGRTGPGHRNADLRLMSTGRYQLTCSGRPSS